MPNAINTSRGLPNLDKAAEVHTVSVATDANGDGSTTVPWDEDFRGGVHAVATPDELCNCAVTASGNSQATVAVGGATADSSVDVTVVVFGDR